jgi:hypothetical protein
MPGEIERDSVDHQPVPGEPISIVGRTDSKEFVKVTFIPAGAGRPGNFAARPGLEDPAGPAGLRRRRG